ncbi:uncharacterized protein MELLADRAFT_106798 [Melampsora larici-populina 98AG31]|uniref:Uncharacterized protein n=1 Tax=Melampsora larici-populina (strain 98AG31 / pathotype 3-4-7) TaxID=747676 RepID=F4RMN9_MELLP|nr:uncharacterized protein MELLADRAFT_106798 [Melampsora larici-populina 98AG31]EGG06348.1 hypothetical protein MELLADRAFT_106798 [Melampsora larici-populina 98AG31]
MKVDYFSIDHGPYQRRIYRTLLYLLFMWNLHLLNQPLLEGLPLFNRGLSELGEARGEIELVSHGVTDSPKHSPTGPLQPLEGIGQQKLSDSSLAPETSLKEKPTLRDLFKKEDEEKVQQDQTEKETTSIDRLYNYLTSRPDHLPAKTNEAFTPRGTVTKKLGANQIEKLKNNELIDYISQFNGQVKLSRDKWKEAEDVEKFSERLVYHEAATLFLKRVTTEDKPTALKNKLKEMREFTKNRLPYKASEKELDQRVLRNFIKDQKEWTFQGVEIAHLNTEKLREDAFWQAKKYITSGMTLVDKVKFTMKKFLNFKLNFKWPWKKST